MQRNADISFFGVHPVLLAIYFSWKKKKPEAMETKEEIVVQDWTDNLVRDNNSQQTWKQQPSYVTVNASRRTSAD